MEKTDDKKLGCFCEWNGKLLLETKQWEEVSSLNTKNHSQDFQNTEKKIKEPLFQDLNQKTKTKKLALCGSRVLSKSLWQESILISHKGTDGISI
jgi:hypothetical protein